MGGVEASQQHRAPDRNKQTNATPATMGRRPPAFAFVSFERFEDAKDAVAGRGLLVGAFGLTAVHGAAAVLMRPQRRERGRVRARRGVGERRLPVETHERDHAERPQVDRRVVPRLVEDLRRHKARSATRGDGLYEGLDWLSQAVASKK